MRRILALVLLLCFAWSQAAAAECPMAAGHGSTGTSSSVHPSPSVDAAAHEHGAHATHTAAPVDASGTGDHLPAHQSAAGCGIVMSCGVVALPTAGGLATLASPLLPGVASPPPAAYRSPLPGTDPPPPRPLV